VEFTVNVTNLNQSTTVASLTTMQYYLIVIPSDSNELCDIHSFIITATNDAGSSIPSESFNREFPSLPDLTPVEQSLQHSMIRTEIGVLLTIKFDVRYVCKLF
jgi:hypothetical protein